MAAPPALAATTPYDYGVQVSVDYTSTAHPASGVTERGFTITTSHGVSQGHLLRIDLRDPRVSLGLVRSPYVADAQPPSAMAAEDHALAAINGDTFDISSYEADRSITTDSAVGPEIVNGRFLKGAVPQGQRLGKTLPPGASPDGVFGVGVNGRAELGTVAVGGMIRSATLTAPIAGYNQFAIPQNSIGLFDAAWGPAPRERAACGTDSDVTAPCLPASSVTEVLIRGGRVISVSDTVGSGQLAPGEVALVGREDGASELDQLAVGERVDARAYPVVHARVPLRWAIGGALTSVVQSQTVTGLFNNDSDLDPYTSAGFTSGGSVVYLVAIDGHSAASASVGVTPVEIAELMVSLGCADAIQLDGGGSTDMVMKASPAAASYTVLGIPSGGAERSVPNGIGVFARR